MSSADWTHSLEAEQSLLGALLLEPGAYDRISAAVSPGDFYTSDHALIFGAVAAMRGAGEAVDVSTLAERLSRTHAEAFRAAGGTAYLGALAQNTPGALNVVRYAELVRERALSRQLDAACQAISESVRGRKDRPVAEILADASSRFAALAESLPGSRRLRDMAADELLKLDLPPLEPLLGSWLCEKCLCMFHARRGVGKTHFALACAFAVATGGKLADWIAPRARGVLYIDGEMPAQLMQRRLGELASGAGEVPELLRIVTPDTQDRPIPDLATSAGQAEIDALVRPETALIVVDNLSCLVRSGGAENESESWTQVSEWALKHRRAGRAIIFIHHSGKTGAQRGTSKREDLLDVVINLRRPAEYQEADGAVFEAHFEKARSLRGEEIAPIEFRLEQLPQGGMLWAYGSAATKLQDRIKALWDGGTLTLTDVLKEAGCSKSHAHLTLERAWAAGELKREYPARRSPRPSPSGSQ